MFYVVDIGLAAVPVTPVPVSVSAVTRVQGPGQRVLVSLECVILGTPDTCEGIHE